jgi:hypothetical protein
MLVLGASLALAQDVCPPGKVTNVSVDTGKSSAAVAWNFSGDDCNTGNATSYKILRSNSSFGEGDWASATEVASGNAGSQGAGICIPIEGLACATTYYWAVLIIDDAGNKTLSNVVQQGTQSCGSIQEISC